MPSLLVRRLLLCALALMLNLAVARAQDRLNQVTKGPFLLSADQVTYDQKLNVVTASGHVEITSGKRILLADRISYNIKQDVVAASGNISLLEPTGEVVFAEYMELDRDLSEGFIKGVRILLSDNSRFAANGGRRTNGNRTELVKAVYSPCEPCKEDPDRAPLWQVKAARVVHDQAAKTIEYHDAVFEVFGVPIAWTPYFSHADPTVKRQSGFLPPHLGSATDLGATVQVPYYWNIAPDRDFTFEPIFTENEGVVGAGQYRQLTDTGEFSVYASGTDVEKRNAQNQRLDEKQFRGHIDSQGRFDLPDNWRWGFDLQRATDDTYLERYRFSSADTLTSDLFAERIDGRNYAAASTYAFQGLNVDDDPGTNPYVLPRGDYSYVIDPEIGGTLGLGADGVSLIRTDGADTRRVSFGGNWELPYVAPAGDVYTLTTSLDFDVYSLNEFRNPETNALLDDEFKSRAFPMVALGWRYPWVRSAGSVRQVVEPVVQLVAAPYGENSSDIPNEDSQSVEFDDTNLFSLNRFPGHDRVESGPHANVGVRLAAYGEEGGYTSAVLGQVFRLRENDAFSDRSGLRDQVSDYVAGVHVVPSDYLDLAYRTRLDHEALTLRRNEVYVGAGPEKFRVQANYVKLGRDLTADELEDREELYTSLNVKLDQYWSAMIDNRRDLTGDGSQIRSGAGLRYRDECIDILLTYDRRFTRDRDIEPSTSINLRIVLKNLS
ncbi:MAG TPA: LPS assembly protein LptD [Alphaproteobacteria bacterium]|jgi:LPS-assembly protein|nr:LPS assembly protein LptD [Alphaproteobacteria bacterium]